MKGSQADLPGVIGHLRDYEGQLVHELEKPSHESIRNELQKRSLKLNLPMARVLLFASNDPGLPGAQLARKCGVRAQTMHHLLSALEKDGLVERRCDGGNARVLRCHITSSGAALMSKSLAAAYDVYQRMVSRLTAQEQKEFRRLLEKCVATLSASKP